MKTETRRETKMSDMMVMFADLVEHGLIEDVVKEVAAKVGYTKPIPVLMAPSKLLSSFAIDQDGNFVYAMGVTEFMDPGMARSGVAHEISHLIREDYKWDKEKQGPKSYETEYEEEAAADAFAVKHGYGPDSIRFMKRLMEMNHPDGDFERGHDNDPHLSEAKRVERFTNLMQTHNSTDEA